MTKMTGTWNSQDQKMIDEYVDMFTDFNLKRLRTLLHMVGRLFLYADKAEDMDMSKEVVSMRMYEIIVNFLHGEFNR